MTQPLGPASTAPGSPAASSLYVKGTNPGDTAITTLGTAGPVDLALSG